MDFDRTEESAADNPVLGGLSLAFGVLGLVSHMLCCFIGGLSLAVSAVLTVLALGTGVVGLRQARPGGDQYLLSRIALVVAGLNVLMLLAITMIQCGLLSLILGLMALD